MRTAGRKRSATSLRKQSSLTLGLLVDTGSGSQRRVLYDERNASNRFLEQVLREDKDLAFVIHFDFEVELLQDLTASRAKLEKALDELQVANGMQPGSQNPNGGGYPGGGGGGYPGGGGGYPGGGGGIGFPVAASGSPGPAARRRWLSRGRRRPAAAARRRDLSLRFRGAGIRRTDAQAAGTQSPHPAHRWRGHRQQTDAFGKRGFGPARRHAGVFHPVRRP